MTGDINIQGNKIFSDSDPSDDRHLSRKNYIDNKITNVNLDLRQRLRLSGGNMTGDINMGVNKILTTSDPTLETHLARKKYVDENLNKLQKDVSFSILKDNFSLKFHNLFLVEYNSVYDLLFSRNGGKIKEWIDFGIEGNNFKQTTQNLQPDLSLENEKLENKYFLKFNYNRMVSGGNLNPPSGGGEDVINAFIVYKLNSVPASGTDWLRGGLFGNDNGRYKKLVAFANPASRELIISGDSDRFIAIGSNSANGKVPIASFQTKANAGDLNKWLCLSVHWNKTDANGVGYIAMGRN